MKIFYYFFYGIPLMVCVILVLSCVPFVVIGEAFNFVASKIMQFGDKIQKTSERRFYNEN